MSNNSPFPEKPITKITQEEVVDYLLQQQRGYQVFQIGDASGGFELVLNESRIIKFPRITNGKIQVQGYSMNNIVEFVDCTSLSDLIIAVDAIAQKLIGALWQRTPSTARVSEKTPATNLSTISKLIGSASIEAVFDPYLTNNSLVTLINILSFGNGSVSNGVRVLSTSKTTGGRIPRLTRAGFDAWTSEFGFTGQIRIMPSKEHRRFLLLNGNQSLILGLSLNAIDKNEAVRVEPDHNDRAFFDQVWSTAIELT